MPASPRSGQDARRTEPSPEGSGCLHRNVLPNRRPDRTWGGPGVGAPCAICGLAVERTELEFEIQFAHDGAAPGLDKFHLHIRCFAAWELERPHA